MRNYNRKLLKRRVISPCVSYGEWEGRLKRRCSHVFNILNNN
ncbi:hypothetical protein NEIMUCOT_04028 [Neisseria mucosa ATCC 25996]|uniref:Uncharacterized protein n=1 Tax=Neisseria mucosa (strain ATCC 25996 / DSM 4631 / NCTC 10774 / M26) TaxID=546266 RepID=D2ZTU1_NEIM2|nr:hypothetical protein NEIMUCOT_04028 [Neisseria mucosa ATCC 25996]